MFVTCGTASVHALLAQKRVRCSQQKRETGVWSVQGLDFKNFQRLKPPEATRERHEATQESVERGQKKERQQVAAISGYRFLMALKYFASFCARYSVDLAAPPVKNPLML